MAALAVAVLACVASPRAAGDGLVDAALRFYDAGGAYCFRLAPGGVAMAEETAWTIMVLTSATNGKKAFKIRELDAGRSGFSGRTLKAFGDVVTRVWRGDRDRAEFFERFAAGITAGRLRARVVRIQPENLASLTTDRDRAELYLTFSERGSRVSFDGAPDLTAADLGAYAEYFPD
jgi:hypothetical protein